MAGGYNNLSPQQNWQSIGGNGFYGYNNQSGAGIPVARDEMDASRIGIGRVPSAEYPDGYLGTLLTRRRDDRLLDSLKSRVNQKAYQRGVHKGERIEPSMYYWPENFGPMMNISRQMKAQVDSSSGATVYRAAKFAPQTQLAPAPHLVNDGKANTLANEPAQINERRQAMLGYLRAPWR